MRLSCKLMGRFAFLAYAQLLQETDGVTSLHSTFGFYRLPFTAIYNHFSTLVNNAADGDGKLADRRLLRSNDAGMYIFNQEESCIIQHFLF